MGVFTPSWSAPCRHGAMSGGMNPMVQVAPGHCRGGRRERWSRHAGVGANRGAGTIAWPGEAIGCSIRRRWTHGWVGGWSGRPAGTSAPESGGQRRRGGRGQGPRRALAQEPTNPRRVDEKKKLNRVVIDKTPNPGVDQSRAGAHTRSTRPFWRDTSISSISGALRSESCVSLKRGIFDRIG